MRLLPAGLETPSRSDDGLWSENPGWPFYEGSWIHPPPEGHAVPEFEIEEGHDETMKKPPPVLIIGSGNDVHIRQPDSRVPRRLCQLMKLGRNWWLEALSGIHSVYCGEKELHAGDRVVLKNSDIFSLLRPPTPLTYKILINDDDNWYIDMGSDMDYPNKQRSMMPCREATCPECPEELKRLAWQTDKMRKRSEDDQIRTADWSAFSQYVKRNFLRYGIECTPWVDAQRPHDEKPPSHAPRAYPAWIADIVAKERLLPGISRERTLPFASCLELSGRQPAEQLSYRREVTRLEERNVDRVATGPAVTRHLGDGGAKVASDGAPAGSIEAAVGRSTGETGLHEQQQRARTEQVKMMPLQQWLASLDRSGCLSQYQDQLAEKFDSLEQIVNIYFTNGGISKAFFEDAGIKKLGHRRILEKWFSEKLGSGALG